MGRFHPSDGKHWDTEEIRREREYGWIRQNEARLVAEAREKRAAQEKVLLSEQAERMRRLHWKKCPRCGADMRSEAIDGVDVERCALCEGTFFERGELERLLLRHDRERRGFFRQLLGPRGH